MDMNVWCGRGRLTRDPSMQFLPNDASTAVTEFGMAINGYNDKVSFIDVKTFGKTAEIINEYGHKGMQLSVEGNLQQDRWEDKDGNKRSKVYVIANRVYLPPKSEGSGDSPKTNIKAKDVDIDQGSPETQSDEPDPDPNNDPNGEGENGMPNTDDIPF